MCVDLGEQFRTARASAHRCSSYRVRNRAGCGFLTEDSTHSALFGISRFWHANERARLRRLGKSEDTLRLFPLPGAQVEEWTLRRSVSS